MHIKDLEQCLALNNLLLLLLLSEYINSSNSVQEVYKLSVILADFGEEAQTATYSILWLISSS